MNPFNCPSTPPSRPNRASSPRSIHLEPPSTPNGDDNPFATPKGKKTPNNRRNMAFLRTPNTSTKNNLGMKNYGMMETRVNYEQKSTFPPTPEFTPHKNRKRKQIDTIGNSRGGFLQSPEQLATEPSFGMFLPTPSTVGSGRRVSPTKVLKAPPVLDFSKITQFDDILAHEEEQDMEQDIEDDDEDVHRLLMNEKLQQQPKRNILANLKMALKSEPQTPSRQLIDDNLVKQWHGKSFNDGESSDDDFGNDHIVSSPIANPFMNSSAQKSPMSYRKTDVDYSTHVEYIHNKTGQKKVVRLLDYQMSLKPKKLNFSNI